MSSSSTLATFRGNLVTQLKARGGLSGVQITEFRPAPDDVPHNEAIWLGDAQLRQRIDAMGLQMEEGGDLELVVWSFQPGDGDTAAAAAEDRALALLREVELQLKADSKVNGAVSLAFLSAYNVQGGFDNEGRFCVVDAAITFLADLSAS